MTELLHPSVTYFLILRLHLHLLPVISECVMERQAYKDPSS